MQNAPRWTEPMAHLMRNAPDEALMYFCPAVLHASAARFLRGFGGTVTYAVKANPGEEVLTNLVAAGIGAFDVASPAEMRAVRRICPQAVLHYNNPVRSDAEIAVARRMGVASYSVDSASELAKLVRGGLTGCTEIAVRLALPVKGAAYDFGAKFGATPERAAELLRQVAALGFAPAVTFHPGTQCAEPTAWGAYIRVVADVVRKSGVRIGRLNVGGGFAAHRAGPAPDLEAIFDHIAQEVQAHFGSGAPALVCEPGRAMVADAFTLVARVKSVREDGALYLNDGIYGGLSEARDMVMTDRVRVLTPQGRWRGGEMRARVVFGPTCDSIDRLPEPLALPEAVAENDYVLFDGMGAYSRSLATGFNGYGPGETVTVARLG